MLYSVIVQLYYHIIKVVLVWYILVLALRVGNWMGIYLCRSTPTTVVKTVTRCRFYCGSSGWCHMCLFFPVFCNSCVFALYRCIFVSIEPGPRQLCDALSTSASENKSPPKPEIKFWSIVERRSRVRYKHTELQCDATSEAASYGV